MKNIAPTTQNQYSNNNRLCSSATYSLIAIASVKLIKFRYEYIWKGVKSLRDCALKVK